MAGTSRARVSAGIFPKPFDFKFEKLPGTRGLLSWAFTVEAVHALRAMSQPADYRGQGRQSRPRVKTSGNQRACIRSALPQSSDVGGARRNFAFVPEGDLSRCSKMLPRMLAQLTRASDAAIPAACIALATSFTQLR
jgi:hypothetical protein